MLPTKPETRKTFPIGTGVLDYFPLALAEVSFCSFQGNKQHNGEGTPLRWDRTKSTDEADALIRHFLERGTIDTDGVRHSAKLAWRALALLQKEIEAEREAERQALITQLELSVEQQALPGQKETPVSLSEEKIGERIAAHQTLVEALRDAGCEVIGSTRDEHGHTHHVINPEHRMGATQPAEGSYEPSRDACFVGGHWVSRREILSRSVSVKK
jgi:hypothetical protein